MFLIEKRRSVGPVGPLFLLPALPCLWSHPKPVHLPRPVVRVLHVRLEVGQQGDAVQLPGREPELQAHGEEPQPHEPHSWLVEGACLLFYGVSLFVLWKRRGVAVVPGARVFFGVGGGVTSRGDRAAASGRGKECLPRTPFPSGRESLERAVEEQAEQRFPLALLSLSLARARTMASGEQRERLFSSVSLNEKRKKRSEVGVVRLAFYVVGKKVKCQEGGLEKTSRGGGDKAEERASERVRSAGRRRTTIPSPLLRRPRSLEPPLWVVLGRLGRRVEPPPLAHGQPVAAVG